MKKITAFAQTLKFLIYQLNSQGLYLYFQIELLRKKIYYSQLFIRKNLFTDRNNYFICIREYYKNQLLLFY